MMQVIWALRDNDEYENSAHWLGTGKVQTEGAGAEEAEAEREKPEAPTESSPEAHDHSERDTDK